MPSPTQVFDHAQRAAKRMIAWLKDADDLAIKVRLDAFSKQIQQIETALWQILEEDTIDSSTGNQLVVLGKIVGVPAIYSDEEVFRVRIKARVRVLKSRGTPEDFYAIFRAVFPENSLVYAPGYPAGFTFDVGEVTEEDAQLAREWLAEAKLAGVKANLIYQTAPEEEMFAFAPRGGPGWGDYTSPGLGGVWAGELEA